MPGKLENKVAVITGAGSGIGKAMAALFAKEGASIVVADVVAESIGKGVILNTASMAGLFGCRAGAAYTSSKHGLVGLTKNIAFMYADKGIRCNAICPGGVITNIGVGGDVNEEGLSRMELGLSTMPSMGNSEELATAALMLVSDDGSFVNGVAIPVDGGWAAY